MGMKVLSPLFIDGKADKGPAHLARAHDKPSRQRTGGIVDDGLDQPKLAKVIDMRRVGGRRLAMAIGMGMKMAEHMKALSPRLAMDAQKLRRLDLEAVMAAGGKGVARHPHLGDDPPFPVKVAEKEAARLSGKGGKAGVGDGATVGGAQDNGGGDGHRRNLVLWPSLT